MHFRTVPQMIWDVSMLTTAGVSLWRGGWAERTVSLGMIVASIVSAVVQNRRDWNGTQWGDFAVDVAYLALIVGVALKSDRLWTLCAAGFQLVAVVIYFARIVDMKVGALAPYRAVVIWDYLVLVAVIVGVWQHSRKDRPSLSSLSP